MRELPSYCKGLDKCPVGSLKNVIRDDGFFFFKSMQTQNAHHICSSKSTIWHQNKKSP